VATCRSSTSTRLVEYGPSRTSSTRTTANSANLVVRTRPSQFFPSHATIKDATLTSVSHPVWRSSRATGRTSPPGLASAARRWGSWVSHTTTSRTGTRTRLRFSPVRRCRAELSGQSPALALGWRPSRARSDTEDELTLDLHLFHLAFLPTPAHVFTSLLALCS
jgi:hypothetical protein